MGEKKHNEEDYGMESSRNEIEMTSKNGSKNEVLDYFRN
jgi:hypothetical protein